MMTNVSRYYTGLSPKRGLAAQFKALDAEIRELNGYLTHYLIQDNQSMQVLTLEKINRMMKEIKQYALTDEEQHLKEQKKRFKVLHQDPNYSDLGTISDAIKNFKRKEPTRLPVIIDSSGSMGPDADRLAELEAEVTVWREMFPHLKFVPSTKTLTMIFKPTKIQES